jgi:succinate dehydrogenase / fumarate reductase iron-sulfur subunit
MKITLKVWRQKDANSKGGFKTYQHGHVSEDMSFLEMIDVLNEELVKKNEDPIAFDHDCREGICGMCSLYINGRPHGPLQTTTCQLHMRSFKDGETITIEPWRAKAFPVVKDLVVDRTAFDRIQQVGGYVNVNTGGVPDANEIPIPKRIADEAFDSQRVLVVVPVWQLVRMPQLCYLLAPRFLSLPYYHKVKWSAKKERKKW